MSNVVLLAQLIKGHNAIIAIGSVMKHVKVLTC